MFLNKNSMNEKADIKDAVALKRRTSTTATTITFISKLTIPFTTTATTTTRSRERQDNNYSNNNYYSYDTRKNIS